jgi:hypothetical protein
LGLVLQSFLRFGECLINDFYEGVFISSVNDPRAVAMSNMELHNSYKCYDSIPTPPDGSKLCNDYKFHTPNNTLVSSRKNNLERSPSVDSLINSSEQDSSLDELSDSDSLCELKSIAPISEKNQDKPRVSDIDPLKDVEPAKEPARKAYLEKSHKSCEYENCGFKKDSVIVSENADEFIDENSFQSAKNPAKGFQLSPPTNVLKNNRRNSIADSIRMETILEEPLETKIMSVKEILARFETMRETAEVKARLELTPKVIRQEFTFPK